MIHRASLEQLLTSREIYDLLSELSSAWSLCPPVNMDLILYQKDFMVSPITTKKPIMADMIALPEPGSI